MITRGELLRLSPEILILAVTEQVMGWKLLPGQRSWAMPALLSSMCCCVRDCEAWNPVMDMQDAWEVFQTCKAWPFSNRCKFYAELGRLLQQQTAEYPEGRKPVLVAWPDAIGFLTPELICRAALLSIALE